jgi:hypothetical protein
MAEYSSHALVVLADDDLKVSGLHASVVVAMALGCKGCAVLRSLQHGPPRPRGAGLCRLEVVPGETAHVLMLVSPPAKVLAEHAVEVSRMVAEAASALEIQSLETLEVIAGQRSLWSELAVAAKKEGIRLVRRRDQGEASLEMR